MSIQKSYAAALADLDKSLGRRKAKRKRKPKNTDMTHLSIKKTAEALKLTATETMELAHGAEKREQAKRGADFHRQIEEEARRAKEEARRAREDWVGAHGERTSAYENNEIREWFEHFKRHMREDNDAPSR